MFYSVFSMVWRAWVCHEAMKREQLVHKDHVEELFGEKCFEDEWSEKSCHMDERQAFLMLDDMRLWRKSCCREKTFGFLASLTLGSVDPFASKTGLPSALKVSI